MNPAELSLAFAREVAGYPGAVLLVYVSPTAVYNQESRLPDYASDWNATIAVLEHRSMSWGTEYVGGQKYFWVESGSLFKIEEGKGPSALMLAAVKCVRESKR